MEGVIKNSEENRVRSLNNANRLHEEYKPLKNDIDRLRRECLGLERLPELHEEEGTLVTPDRFANHYYPPSKIHTPQFLAKASDWTRPLVPNDSPLANLPPSLPTTFLPPPSSLRLISNKPEPGRASTSVGLGTQPGPPTPSFRSDFLNLRSDFFFVYFFFQNFYLFFFIF